MPDHDSGHDHGPDFKFPHPVLPPYSKKWRWFWIAVGVAALGAVILFFVQ